MFYVYEHWRPDRDECFYVGKGKAGRANSMSKRNLHHKAIQTKLHRLGLAVEVKFVSFGLTEEQAFNLEKERISFWRGIGLDLANLTSGGDGISNFSHSEKTKIKMSVSAKKANTPEVRKKKSDSRKGIVFSEETRKKISKSLIGQKRAKGKRSEEFRKKISSILKGKKLSPEQKEQRRQSMLVVWQRRKEKFNAAQ